jgi:hypothetical protein
VPLPYVQVPTETLVVLLGLVFAVQNPLLPITALVFFAVTGTICRYNWLYIFTQRFQGGGMVRTFTTPFAHQPVNTCTSKCLP